MSVPQKNLPAGITTVRVLVRPMNEQIPVVPVPSFTGNHQPVEEIDRRNPLPGTSCGVNRSCAGVRERIVPTIPARSAASGQEAHQKESWKKRPAPIGSPAEERGRYWDRTSDLCRVKAALSR